MPATRLSIFISSVQKELAEERRTLKNYILNDPLLKRFVSDVFLFEDLPASDRRADDVYLTQVERSDVYVGLFGMEYGREDSEGFSPTEREFDHATAKGKTRLVFVKGSKDKGRHPKMNKLIQKAGSQLIRRRFSDIPDLTAAVYASLVEYLERAGKLQTLPFDAAACPRASMGDISSEKLKWFLATARRERNYALSEKTPARKALAHLNLLDGKYLPRMPQFFSSAICLSDSFPHLRSSACIFTAPWSENRSRPIRYSRGPFLNWWTMPWILSCPK